MSEFQDYLTEILLYVESLSMPDGDYLRIANALQRTFQEREAEPEPEEENWTTFSFPSSSFKMAFKQVNGNLRGKAFDMIHVSFHNIRMNTNHRGEHPHFQIALHIYYTYKDIEEPPVWKGWVWDSKTHAPDVLFTIYRPQHVSLQLHNATFQCNCTDIAVSYQAITTIMMNYAKDFFWSKLYPFLYPS